MSSSVRYQVLDGWRGLSIVLVLVGHLFPVGPKGWGMNEAIAATGMAMFFILSGFLIVSLLLRDDHAGRFLIRRFMRIVPLAWLVLLISLLLARAEGATFLAHLLFYANWEPMALTVVTSHFWSLCVEVQFYVGIALLVWLAGSRALLVLPVLALAFTAFRVTQDVKMAINTYYRVDEILAGGVLALLYQKKALWLERNFLARVHPMIWFAFLIASAHSVSEALNYLRPYIAMCMIGSSLVCQREDAFFRLLKGRVLSYLATVSYALYVIHGGMRASWLGSGDALVKYLKRPLFLAVAFALAHLSTFYYEKYFMELGRRWVQRWSGTAPGDARETA